MKRSDILSPFSRLYGAITNVRAKLYERDFFKSYNLGVPVISIGNITVGGTGKTPLVAVTAQILAANGEKVCILTRGYKRENDRERILVSDGEKILTDARRSGDEPFELAQKLLGKSAVVADANRTEAGKWAREKLNSTVFILDDGFQHLRVRRDLDIVCVDATNPFGNETTLPAGILREPLKNLSRAGVFVVTRADLVDEIRIAKIKKRIKNFNPEAKIFVSTNKAANFSELKDFFSTGKKADSNTDQRLPISDYLVFCALGNSDAFFEQLRREAFDIAATKAFPDHHSYVQKDITELEKKAAAAGAKAFLTTAKDAVKLRSLKFEIPCLVVESRVVFDDEESFRHLIAEAGKSPAAINRR